MKRTQTPISSLLILMMILSISFLGHSQSVNVTGTLQKWHKITVALTLPGTNISESETTFRNNRMDVIFTSPSGRNIRVPGFFAADGNAANSNAKSGKVYKAYLRPDETGNWSYRALFYTANNVSITNVSNLPNPTYNLTGNIGNVSASNKTVPDLRAKGRLQYKTTGTDSQRRYLQFAETGEYYLKLGPDSPENFLNYNDFDADVAGNINSGFTPEHQYNPHASDFNTGNPTWDGGKGRNIIGALNYLKNERMNSVSMSLFGGDDKNVYPWTRPNDKFIYDVSKLEQWEIVLDHAEHNGLMLHLKLAENENWDALNSNELKTYYREMIARFSHHLAVEWNFSEEYRGTPASAIERIDFMAANDPWQNPRVIHTYPDEHNKYATWLSLNAKLTGASIQSSSKNNYASAYNGPDGILTWINNSKNNGTPWVVASDEQNPGGTGIFTSQNIANNSVKTEARTRILWKTMIAGGPGVMWYGGGQGDFKTENFNRFNTLFNWSRYAVIDFFQNNNIEFWKTSNNDNLVSGNANCLAETGRTYVIYLENGGSTNLNLNGQSGVFSVQWFNPRNGGTLLNGTVTQVNGGANRSIGNPPNSANSDWVALVRQNGTDPVSGVNITQASVSINVGRTSNLTASVTPSSAANRDVTWSSNNTAVATVNANGVVTGIAEGSATITVTTVDGGFTATSNVTVTTPPAVTGAWVESDGYLVIDTESLDFPTNSLWSKKTTGGNQPLGNGFMQYDGPDRQFVAPLPDGVLTYNIKINTPGTYQFIWRTGYGFNSASFDGANDSWLKIKGSDFYGRKGNTKHDNRDEFMKVWVQKDAFVNECFGEHRGVNGMTIFADFDTPGYYSIEVAGRSKGHVIDRLFLFQSGKRDLAFSLTAPESPREGNTNPIAVTGVSISPATIALNVGQTGALTANFTPADATNKAITWSSNNTNIATVNANGVVTAVANGNAIITGTTTDGGFTATSTITVGGGSGCTDTNLNAIIDFPNRELPGFAPGYVDNIRNALAIDASRFKDQFAAATTSFSGESGTYDITINTLRELDGESTYRIFINDVLIGTFQNPTTTVDYAPASQTFPGVSVPNEAVLRVEFNSNTNGNIPEGNSTAYSRGRWTSLEFKCNNNTPPPPTGDTIILGNGTNNNTGANLDEWNSNMVINESDTYTNTTGSEQTLSIDQFVFYANREADPVTPFLVKVNADNDFIVLAVGTTRTSATYNVGENTFDFNTGTAKQITLANGETIAPGFLDANANGSGGNIGSVIPFDQTASADQLWYSGGPDGNNSGSVVEGVAPTAGLNLITTLNRNYRFKINLSKVQTADCSAAPTGLAVTGVTDTSVTFSFDNTANDTRNFELRAFPEGEFTGNINVGAISFSSAEAGSTTITISGLEAGTIYDFAFRALCGINNTPGTSENATISATTSGGIPPADCSTAPTGLTVANVTDTSVTISYANTANDTRTFELRAFSQGTFNGDISAPGAGFATGGAGSNSITMNNLNAGTSYDFVLRALCGPDVSPSTVATVIGSTSGGNIPVEDCSVAPTGLTQIGSTTTSVTFSFNNTSNDIRTFEIRPFAPGTFTGDINTGALGYASAPTGSTTITIGNLQAGTSYDFVFRAICSENPPSPTTVVSGSTDGTSTPQTITLTPVEDAYVQGTSGVNQNVLRVQQGFRTSYLKFDVSAINGPITSASIKLTVDEDAGNGNIQVLNATSNNWSESNLNSSNAPGNGNALGNLNQAFNKQTAYTFNLSNLSVSGDFLSLVVMHTGSNDVSFKSSEASGGTPELTINYNGTAAIKQSSTKDGFITAYPNPANDQIFLKGLAKNSSISILDMTGRSVAKNLVSLHENMELNIVDLESGMYFIQIKGSKQEQTIPFIKK